jgi:hypothetical protein
LRDHCDLQREFSLGGAAAAARGRRRRRAREEATPAAIFIGDVLRVMMRGERGLGGSSLGIHLGTQQ